MKPSPRFFRIHVFVGLAWAQTVVSLFAAEKPVSPETPGLKQVDPGWPREITRNGIRFVYYQPQVDEWKDFRELRARLAFVLTPKDGKPAVGVEELKGRTTANVEARTVLIDDIEITAVRFPALSSDEEANVETLLKSTFPGKPLTVSLDRLITSVQASQEKAKPVPVKTDPPSIMVSTEPAVLLTVQGDPVLAPIQGIKFVLNANWDLFFDSAASKYYLLVDKLWLSADSLEGPWSAVKKLPSDFSNFPDTQNNAAKRSSDELTNSLNREAAARQRGSEKVNLQQKWQGRTNAGSRWETNRGSRNWGGGGGRGRFRD